MDAGAEGTAASPAAPAMDTTETEATGKTIIDDDELKRKVRQSAAEDKSKAKASKEATKKDLEDKLLPKRGVADTEIWDLAGHGDCGYRCLAAATAQTEGKADHKEITDNISKMAALLRKRVANHFSRNGEWETSWAYDDKATRTTEDGDIPTSAKEWQMAIERPRRWICHHTMIAASEVLHREILVYEWRNCSWRRLAHIVPKVHKKNADPIVMMLINKHFVTVKLSTNGKLSPGLMQEHKGRAEDTQYRGASPATPSGSSTREGGTASRRPERESTRRLLDLMGMSDDETVGGSVRSMLRSAGSAASCGPTGSAASSGPAACRAPSATARASTKRPKTTACASASAASADTRRQEHEDLETHLQPLGGRQRRIGLTEGTDSFTWKCKVCAMEFFAKGARALALRKCRHCKKAHSLLPRSEMPMLRPQLQEVEPTDKIAPEHLSWRYAECGKGLPAMPVAGLRSNAKAHLAVCCPGVSMQENRWRAVRKFEGNRAACMTVVKKMLLQRFTRTKDERYEAKLNGELGHDVVQVVLHEGLLCGPQGAWKNISKAFACRRCWRLFSSLGQAVTCRGAAERPPVMRGSGRLRLCMILRTDRKNKRYLEEFDSKLGTTADFTKTADDRLRAIMGKEAKQMYKVTWAAPRGRRTAS